jgi:CRP-like cAMP-binding protein
MSMRRLDRQTKDLADELGAVPAFEDLDGSSLAALAVAGRVVHLPAGWALIAEDTPADSVYVLLEGDLEVRHGSTSLASLTPGALVGEAALVSHRRRHATVVTLTPVRAFRLAYDETPGLFDRYPEIAEVFRREWDRKSATEAYV